MLWFVLAAAAAATSIGLWVLDMRRKKTASSELSGSAEYVREPQKPGAPRPGVRNVRAPQAKTRPTDTESEASFRDKLPGSARRERRSWALNRGYEFIKKDDFLNDEWTRGVAATGAQMNNVVSGMAAGYEMYLGDMAGVTVMAMRRGASSDVVIDARRSIGGSAVQPTPPVDTDLTPVSTIAGFDISSTDVGVATRWADERVTTALDNMPEDVIGVWLESDWVLAHLHAKSGAAQWDALFEPLSLLADTSRVLPPRGTTKQSVEDALLHPTRPVPTPRVMTAAEEQAAAEAAAAEAARRASHSPLYVAGSKPVHRPEEPVQLPSRMHSEVRGVVEPRQVGVDEVEAIANGGLERKSSSAYERPRIVRKSPKGPSIFDDLTDEFGTDPLRKDPDV